MNGLERLEREYDVVIVGARVAGAATAMLLARAGLRVLAAERSPEGSDTISTHALMRGAVLQLSKWGLLPALEAAGTPAIRTTTFHYGSETLAIPIKARDGVDALIAPRRTVLDPLLVAAARAAGATVLHGVRAVDLVRDATGRVRGVVLAGRECARVQVRAGIVVGADGIHSNVAGLAGAAMRHVARHSSPNIYRYVPDLDLDGYHWHYAEGVSAGGIPTNGGLTAVFAAVPRERYERERPGGLAPLFARALAEAAPELAARAREARVSGPTRAFGGEPGFLRRAHGPGWALVGDAGAFRDPITSHGIADALRDAEWLANAIVSGTSAALDEYEAARDDLMRDLIRVSDAIASFDWTLGEVRNLHLELSRHMARGVEALLRGPQSVGAGAGTVPGVAAGARA